MPIDFFDNGGQIQSTISEDDNIQPISLKVCRVITQDHQRVQRWSTVGTFRCEEVLEAIQMLFEVLTDDAYFGLCTGCNIVRPSGQLNHERFCSDCLEESSFSMAL